jgi:hypothetical protein
MMETMEFWIRFVLAVLATWRVTHLLANEDGPADVIVRLRSRLGDSLAGQMMDCFNCLSLWVAAAAAIFVARTPLEWLFGWLALSGAACLLQRLGPEPVAIEPISEPIEGETDHVLWSEAPSSGEFGKLSQSRRPGEGGGHGNSDRASRH